MDFLDNVVKSSNAILKERLNNPFGGKTSKQDSAEQSGQAQDQPGTSDQQTHQQQPTESHHSATTSTNIDATTATNNQPPATNYPNDPSLNGDSGNSQFAAIAADAEMVTQKAVKGAKNFGSFLFSMANKAGQTVTQTAKQVKQVVENTNILTDLTREQQDFIKVHGGSMQAGELPWANCSDEAKAADIREQILTLSQDRRNFVRNPPSETNFQFDQQQCYPMALSLLKEDPNLSKMRFELVPKLVNEDTFWRNYFYRVSLLKQMSDKGDDLKRQGWASSRSSSGEGPDEVVSTTEEAIQSEIASPSYSATSTHFQGHTTTINQDTSGISAAQELEYSESQKLVAEADDLKSKLRELNIGSLDDSGGQDEDDKWEEELQKDLQEFELVSGDVSALDEEALDDDIKELRNSGNQKS